jgi:ABC-type nitrate/sulfonate/bicarbonate transport system substrate-binding protein
MTRFTLRLLLTSLCWFQLLAIVGAADKIRLAVPDVGGQFLTFPLAQNLGMLKQEGIDGEIILIRGNAALAALSSGDVDYSVGIPQGVRGALAGLPLKIVACFEPSSTLLLLSQAKIKSLSELSGKTIAVGAAGGAPTRIARMILKQAKVNADKEVKFLSAGPASARLALLKQGLADAAMVPPPFDVEGRKLGYVVLARTHEVLSFPQSGLVIHSRRLKEKPDEIKKMIKAGIKANGYVRANRDGAVKFLMAWQRADGATAAATYDAVRSIYNADGNIPADGLGLVIQDTKEALELKSEMTLNDLVELAPLRAAQMELGLKVK